MEKQILIVDDNELNRELLSEMLRDRYRILEADDGQKAIDILYEKHGEIAAVLLDLIMPVKDGFDVLKVFQKENWIDRIPVLIISSENSVDAEKKCFDYGIPDFIHKPFDASLVRRRVKNITELFAYKNSLEQMVEKQTEVLKEQNQLLQEQATQLEKTNRKIIDIMGNIVESRNLESGQHIMRVKGYTKILALHLMRKYPEYQLTREKAEKISEASALHDIGKIAIPDAILLKPGKLSKDEFEFMKTHTTKGGEILKKIREIWSEEYAELSYEICMHHHERYDGRGYPYGLAGDDIPISAQLVSVADVYDALVNERCYKDAFSKEKAFNMIIGGECGVFSPKLLDCFKDAREEFEAFAAEGV